VSVFGLPIRRPVATSMVFLGVLLLGLVAWYRIPVELLPPVSGEDLHVGFVRPGSDPEVVEREILLPLEARVSELPGVEETSAEIRGSSGSFRVRFARGTDIEVRELDLRRLAADLVRGQPRGTSIEVRTEDLAVVSRFVMFVQVRGLEDRNVLQDFVEQRIIPRLGAVAGVSRVLAGGGASREITVEVDPDRCAALGVSPEQVVGALARSVTRVRFTGGAEDEAGRTAVLVDGRPRGVDSLAETRITSGRPLRLRHVAEVEQGAGREEMLFRVNGRPAVGLVVFQEEGANLVRLGSALRRKLDDLREEYGGHGLEFVVNFDASATVQKQLDRLKELALSGFGIALAVLYLFLRQWRAVLVVAVAVPFSLLAAAALLFLAGQSLNLITLFGLAVGIGMLVDNSIVVYEAVQRRLERGVAPDAAAERGVRITVRAILAASVCNAIVFLPLVFVDFEQALTRSLLMVLALAMVLPMVGSVLVAVGLVPLLARRLAAPAAVARLRRLRAERDARGGLARPDRARELFGGVLVVALRRPAAWFVGVGAALVLTVVVALPWVAGLTVSREPPEAETVRFSVDIASAGSLERAVGVFERLELSVLGLEGIEFVESMLEKKEAR
jgi:HAE1 family hydrophobic/amphiphilic exporter-1